MELAKCIKTARTLVCKAYVGRVMGGSTSFSLGEVFCLNASKTLFVQLFAMVDFVEDAWLEANKANGGTSESLLYLLVISAVVARFRTLAVALRCCGRDRPSHKSGVFLVYKKRKIYIERELLNCMGRLKK